MSEREWTNVAISACLEKAFAGEWGAEPAPANAVVLRATDIDNDGHVVGVGAPRAIPKGKLSAKQMIDGDILLEGSGGSPDNPVGRVALFETADHVQPTICSNFFKTLRPNRQLINERFLWRKLCWFYRQPALLSMQQQTTGIINLKFQDYLAAEITLPADKAEQAKIAEVLDTLDTTIRQTEAFIEKLKQVKQGLLHDLLTRGIDANGELRPPQIEAPHLYKASPLGWIPRAWGAKVLNELIDQRRPIVYGILMPGQGYEGGVPVVKVKDIIGGSILLDQLLLTSPAIDREYKRSRLIPGDLLFTIRGSVGRTAFVPTQLDGANITQDTARIGLVGTDPRFVREYLAMPIPAKFIATHTLGVAVQGINLGDVRRIPIACPEPHEAKLIADTVESSNERIATELKELHKLKLAKFGLMDDLLTGHVRVTPLLTQPATT